MDDFISKPIESEEFYEFIEKYAVSGGRADNVLGGKGDLQYREPELQDLGDTSDKTVFDSSAFRQRIGDEALMCELIRIFEDELEAMWDALRTAAGRGDAEAIYESAHRLKGLVGNFCARRAWDCATELNERVKHEDPGDMSEAVDSFERELRLLEASLSEFREVLEGRSASP